MNSGVATPGHTHASAHVKITGARVMIMWKAKVKDQAWSHVSCGHEVSIQVRLNKWYLWPKMTSQAISEWERAPDFLADTCYVRNGCAHAVPMLCICNLLIRLRHWG